MRFIQSLSIFYLFSSSIAKDHDEDRRILERNAAIEADLLDGQKPIHGMKKMSNDEGEKFFMDYWGVSSEGHNTEWLMGNNNTDPEPGSFQPPVSANRGGGRGRGRGILDVNKRDFQCPAGSKSCTAINRPSSCCGTDETCELVEDTGSGDVGCCPRGQQCSGNIGTCQSGYQACPASLGGGCCFPGYDCVDGGCAYISIVTVTVHSTTMESTVTYTSSMESSSMSMPSRTSTDSTGDLAPPARATSLTTATASESSETGLICPVGFYACSAVYHGGCCRTGRNCDTTSCPQTSSTTVESNAHGTIVAPVDATSTGGGGSTEQCAGGWYSCAADMGGGCCPTGFACGSQSCTATATGGGVSATGTTVAKSAAAASGRSLLGTSKGVLGMRFLYAYLFLALVVGVLP